METSFSSPGAPSASGRSPSVRLPPGMRRSPSASIRLRLVLLFIAFTLIPVAITGGISAWLGTRDGIARVKESLSGIAALKEVQLKNWQTSLENALAAEIERNTKTQLLTSLLSSEPATSLFEAIARNQLYIFNNAIASEGIFDEISLLNRQGVVILSTRPEQEGRAQGSIEFFRKGIEGSYVSSPAYDISLGYLTIIVAQPVVSDQGEALGVLIGRANLKALDEIMLERTGLGQTGEIYLVNRNLLLVTPTRSLDTIPGESYIRTQGAESSAVNGQDGAAEYSNYADKEHPQGIPVVGAYIYIPELQVGLIAEQQQSEALSTVRATTIAAAAAAFGAAIFAILAALLVSRNISRPLIELTQTAESIAGGNLNLQAMTARRDEIGVLAAAFNSMTQQLRQLIEGLEERVAERTRQLQLRSEQLEAASEVGRSVVTILDTNQLIQQVVERIQQRFDLYYVGLFLADENREWAVLRAGTGRAGQAMLARSHRLKIGAGSMIGWSIANAQARIALEAGEDPERLATPDLPDTRSEAAIPLRSRGQVLGALTIQSAIPAAFDQEAISVFQTMADQVAAALDNARLFAEAQHALETVQEAYGQLSRQAWLERLQPRPIAFRRDASGFSTTADSERPSASLYPKSAGAEDAHTHTHTNASPTDVRQRTPLLSPLALMLPIKARGQTIGYLNAQKPEGASSWQEQEIGMMENLIDQLGISLESARLFEASQQQAERERLVGEITSRMRATLDLDAVLQTAARELRAALDLSEVEVRLGDFGSRRETGDGRAGGAETPRSSGQAEDGGQEGAEHA